MVSRLADWIRRARTRSIEAGRRDRRPPRCPDHRVVRARVDRRPVGSAAGAPSDGAESPHPAGHPSRPVGRHAHHRHGPPTSVGLGEMAAARARGRANRSASPRGIHDGGRPSARRLRGASVLSAADAGTGTGWTSRGSGRGADLAHPAQSTSREAIERAAGGAGAVLTLADSITELSSRCRVVVEVDTAGGASMRIPDCGVRIDDIAVWQTSSARARDAARLLAGLADPDRPCPGRLAFHQSR